MFRQQLNNLWRLSPPCGWICISFLVEFECVCARLYGRPINWYHGYIYGYISCSSARYDCHFFL